MECRETVMHNNIHFKYIEHIYQTRRTPHIASVMHLFR